MLSFVIRWSLLFALLPLCYTEFLHLIHIFTAAPLKTLADPFILSLLIYIPVRWAFDHTMHRLALNNPLHFLDVLEHELTHLLVGLLFFKAPHRLMASRDGNGYVEITSANFIITLAPYVMPAWAFILTGLSYLISIEFQFFWTLLCSAAFANFIYRLAHEIHFKQNDLRSTGFIFSLLFIGAVFPVLSSFLLALHSPLNSIKQLGSSLLNSYIPVMEFIKTSI
jgi:hypothetical protein